MEGSKVPREESVAGFTPGEKEGAQLPLLSQRVRVTGALRPGWVNSPGCREDKGRPLKSQRSSTGHWSRSRMGRRNNSNQEAVRTEAGRWRPYG